MSVQPTVTNRGRSIIGYFPSLKVGVGVRYTSTIEHDLQWRSIVPWQSERGFVRYAHQHLRPLFPGLLCQSAYNWRLRRLWGAFLLIPQAVGQDLADPHDWEVMDCVPVPVAHGAHSFHPGRLADIPRIGKGGNDRFFFGLHLLLAVSVEGVITDWTLTAGNVQDRWLAELLLSARAGQLQLTGPQHNASGTRVQPPSDWVGPTVGAGVWRPVPILAGLGYYGSEWYQHWLTAHGDEVLTASEQTHHSIGHLFSSWRQVVQTAFANLCETLGLKYPGAHITWACWLAWPPFWRPTIWTCSSTASRAARISISSPSLSDGRTICIRRLEDR